MSTQESQRAQSAQRQLDADGVRHGPLVVIDALRHVEVSGASQTEVLVSGASESSEAFQGFQFTHHLYLLESGTRISIEYGARLPGSW